MSIHARSSRSEAHEKAIARDARTVLRPGEERIVVVWKPPEKIGGECAMTKIENIKTFIHPGPHELTYGDTVDIKILDVGDNHAEVVAIDIL